MMAMMIGALIACSSTLKPTSDTGRLKEFAFLQPGVTSAEEVTARLGEPFAVYEDGRVQTYHLEFMTGKYQTTSKRYSDYRLVLAFRTDHVLERWSLVKAI